MKKLFMILMSVLMVGTLVACGQTDVDTDGDTKDDIVDIEGGSNEEDTAIDNGENLEGQPERTLVETALDQALEGLEYPAMEFLDLEGVESFVEIPSELIADHVFAMPMMNVHATTMVVIKAVDEEALKAIETQMNAYFELVEENWSTYLPEQYDLAQNRIEKTFGNYYMGIISENAETIATSIETYLTVDVK